MLVPQSLAEEWTDVLSAPAGHLLRGTAVCFPQVPHLPRETLDWACHTPLLTGRWDQNLGAYLFLVSSSHCCVLTPMFRLRLLQKALLPHRPAPRWKGNERTFLAAGGAREMTGRAEASDISIKQTCLALRTGLLEKPSHSKRTSSCLQFTQPNAVPTSPLRKKWCFTRDTAPGSCTLTQP